MILCCDWLVLDDVILIKWYLKVCQHTIFGASALYELLLHMY